MDSNAFILSNEAVTDGFPPEGEQDGELTTDGSTDDQDAQNGGVPKCFVNLMYEDLPEVPT